MQALSLSSYFKIWYPALPQKLLVRCVDFSQNVGQSPFISFVNELDYFSISIARKYPCKERVISAEELGTMSKNDLRGITLGIDLYGGFTLLLHRLLSLLITALLVLVTSYFYRKLSKGYFDYQYNTIHVICILCFPLQVNTTSYSIQ